MDFNFSLSRMPFLMAYGKTKMAVANTTTNEIVSPARNGVASNQYIKYIKISRAIGCNTNSPTLIMLTMFEYIKDISISESIKL